MARARPTSTAVRELHNQIAGALEEAAGRPATTAHAHAQREPITFYGVPPEAWSDLRRRWRRPFAELSVADRLALAKLLLASHIEEQGYLALAVLRAGLQDLSPATFEELDRLVDDFCSWSMTDDFASGKASITWHLLQRYPTETLNLLRRWVSSPNRWKRRATVITFTRAVAASGDFLDETLEFCQALQHDPDDLVQKGVGWALKDAMLAGPGAQRRVIALVKRMRRAGVPSTVTLYAIRRLKGEERDAVLKVTAAR